MFGWVPRAPRLTCCNFLFVCLFVLGSPSAPVFQCMVCGICVWVIWVGLCHLRLGCVYVCMYIYVYYLLCCQLCLIWKFGVSQFCPHIGGQYCGLHGNFYDFSLFFFRLGNWLGVVFSPCGAILLHMPNFPSNQYRFDMQISLYIRFFYLWLLSCNWQDFISSRQLRFRQGLLSFVGISFVLFYFSYLQFGLLLWNIELICMF